VGAAAKCHCKQATGLVRLVPYDEEACEQKAKAKFDSALAKASFLCPSSQIAAVTALRDTLLADQTDAGSLDAQNGDLFCDSTSGALIAASDPDDAGWVPSDTSVLKCECAVGTNLGKLVAAVVKCHLKLATKLFKGGFLDDEACEALDPITHRSALEKYTVAAAKTLLHDPSCPACLDQAQQDALGSGAVSYWDATNALIFPCP
jgi:hypothetical protein